MAPIEFSREEQRAKGPANILAIGTANPPNIRYQDEFPDFLFRMSGSEHMQDLKMKFKHICDRSMIKKRYTYMTEKFIKDTPSILAREAPSLDDRLNFEINLVPELGSQAASKAIQEWGRPKSCITHVVFHTYSALHMPGADYQLVQILGLEPTVKRFMIYHNGCYAGGTVLRLAKDLAENNVGARVLAVCSESMMNGVHGPSREDSLDQLVAYAIFGDGAAAAIVGSDPDMSIERPIYQMISANQSIIPNSNGALCGRFHEKGFFVTLSKDVANLVSSNIESNLAKSFEPLGVSDWNSLFWIVHPGGAAILNAIEAKLGLKEEKLEATRHVLSEYGNMSSPTVIFILDEMRKKSQAKGKETTGNGYDMGVLIGIGPGLTMETIVLRSFPTCATH